MPGLEVEELLASMVQVHHLVVQMLRLLELRDLTVSKLAVQ